MFRKNKFDIVCLVFLCLSFSVKGQDFYGYNLKDSLSIKEITIKRKKLKELPKEIYSFKNLEVLNLKNNRLDSLSKEILVLTKLKHINLAKNKFQVFPTLLFDFNRLEKIELWDNWIQDIPENNPDLKKIKYIDITGVALKPDVYNRLIEKFKNIELILTQPCNCSTN